MVLESFILTFSLRIVLLKHHTAPSILLLWLCSLCVTQHLQIYFVLKLSEMNGEKVILNKQPTSTSTSLYPFELFISTIKCVAATHSDGVVKFK